MSIHEVISIVFDINMKPFSIFSSTSNWMRYRLIFQWIKIIYKFNLGLSTKSYSTCIVSPEKTVGIWTDLHETLMMNDMNLNLSKGNILVLTTNQPDKIKVKSWLLGTCNNLELISHRKYERLCKESICISSTFLFHHSLPYFT